MNSNIFSVVQKIGRFFFLPMSVLPVAGILLGIGASFTNPNTIKTFNLENILGDGTFLHGVLVIMSSVGSIIFSNLPIIFALAVALGMARNEKAVAVLASALSFLAMNTTVNALLKLSGQILPDGSYSSNTLQGAITTMCGIETLQMGVFGGIVVGLVTAFLHNKFYKQQLPMVLSYFAGIRFVPIICVIAHIFVGAILFFIWPTIQQGIFAISNLIMASGYIGTFIFGFMERILIPYGLHHVFYIPFWQTGLGGTAIVDGVTITGAQNIFFAQLASPNVTQFSVEACRFMTGKYSFMMAGLPAAALAMYHCAKPENKKIVGGLLVSAALTSFVTGITEPIEFTFLFIAPALFVLHCVLAGFSFVLMHMLNICIGTTFSCGLIDFILYGVLQGQAKTNWLMILPVFVGYFVLYYFIFKFVILKFNLPTPGRGDSTENKLYTKEDYLNKKKSSNIKTDATNNDTLSPIIIDGLGGTDNILDINSCATRLRITIKDNTKINETILKQTGSAGIIQKGNGIQIIYGPQVSIIHSNLEEYIAYMNKPIDKSTHDSSTIKGELKAVSDGKVISLSNVPDETFSSKALGDGYAIQPSKGEVVAPISGTITMLMEKTNHAIGIKTDDDIDILIHIGIDTVTLNGVGFTPLVKIGQKVNIGDKLINFDKNYIEKNHLCSDIIVIILNNNNTPKIKYTTDIIAKAGKTTIGIW